MMQPNDDDDDDDDDDGQRHCLHLVRRPQVISIWLCGREKHLFFVVV
jgi:hypothetical protein